MSILAPLVPWSFLTLSVTSLGVDRIPGETDPNILGALVDAAERIPMNLRPAIGPTGRNGFVRNLHAAKDRLAENPKTPWLDHFLIAERPQLGVDQLNTVCHGTFGSPSLEDCLRVSQQLEFRGDLVLDPRTVHI